MLVFGEGTLTVDGVLCIYFVFSPIGGEDYFIRRNEF